jgi:hypothetical protein
MRLDRNWIYRSWTDEHKPYHVLFEELQSPVGTTFDVCNTKSCGVLD